MTDRQAAALQQLGLSLAPDAPPSVSAIVWACVEHAVRKTGGNAEHAAAWADRMATVADIAAGSPDDQWPLVPWPHAGPEEPPVFPHQPGAPW